MRHFRLTLANIHTPQEHHVDVEIPDVGSLMDPFLLQQGFGPALLQVLSVLDVANSPCAETVPRVACDDSTAPMD